MEDLIFRDMLPHEADEVYAIGKKAFKGIEKLWIGRPQRALVALYKDKLVGAIMYKFLNLPNHKVGYVDYAFMDPAYHGQGIGGRLYEATFEFLWHEGCDSITAIVKDDNVASWKLFLDSGFTRVSLPELVRHFGFLGCLQHYFKTPFGLAFGMEYYVLSKEPISQKSKVGSFKQIIFYFGANLLLASSLWFGFARFRFEGLFVYAMLLLVWMGFGFLGTLLAPDYRWGFRLTNGGGLVCLVVNLFSLLPLIGNWYPDHYEKNLTFKRNLGVVAFMGWLGLFLCAVFFSISSYYFSSLGHQIALLLLIYSVLPFYPFESFGGRRVYDWHKGFYGVMLLCSSIFIGYMFL